MEIRSRYWNLEHKKAVHLAELVWEDKMGNSIVSRVETTYGRFCSPGEGRREAMLLEVKMLASPRSY